METCEQKEDGSKMRPPRLGEKQFGKQIADGYSTLQPPHPQQPPGQCAESATSRKQPQEVQKVKRAKGKQTADWSHCCGYGYYCNQHHHQRRGW